MVFLLLWRRQIATPHSQSCEGVLGLGGVANGVLPSHSVMDCEIEEKRWLRTGAEVINFKLYLMTRC
jgi:hypothetical protein